MRWIADADKERIERARDLAANGGPIGDHIASLLNSVLSNMRRLEVEQPPQQPSIVPLSTEQRRAIYPERYL